MRSPLCSSVARISHRNAPNFDFMAKDSKVIAPKRKTRQKAPKPPKTDFFTKLCHTTLQEECVMEFRFHPKRMWRFDYAFPQHKIALEVEGGVWTQGRHTSPKGFLGDMEKYNTATAMGWRVFRTTPDELIRTATFDFLKMAINGTYDPEKCDFYPKVIIK